jgi:hypothetical protein
VTILPALRTLAPDVQMIVAAHSDAVRDQACSFERFLLVEAMRSQSRSIVWMGPSPTISSGPEDRRATGGRC